VTKRKSPYECLFHITPNYKFLKTFGCECWPLLRPYNSSKLSFRSTSYVFIGYSKNHLDYKCLHHSSGRIYIARHVVFNENHFPFSKSTTPRISSSPPISSSLSLPLISTSTPPHFMPCLNTSHISSATPSFSTEPACTSQNSQPVLPLDLISH